MPKQFEWFCRERTIYGEETLPPGEFKNGEEEPNGEGRWVKYFVCVRLDNKLIGNQKLYEKLNIFPEREISGINAKIEFGIGVKANRQNQSLIDKEVTNEKTVYRRRQKHLYRQKTKHSSKQPPPVWKKTDWIPRKSRSRRSYVYAMRKQAIQGGRNTQPRR